MCAAMAAPAAESEKAAEALAPQACLPASCQSFGVSTTHCISKPHQKLALSTCYARKRVTDAKKMQQCCSGDCGYWCVSTPLILASHHIRSTAASKMVACLRNFVRLLGRMQPELFWVAWKTLRSWDSYWFCLSASHPVVTGNCP